MGNENLILSFHFQMKTLRLKGVKLPAWATKMGTWLTSDTDFVYSSLFLLLKLIWPFYHLFYVKAVKLLLEKIQITKIATSESIQII